MRNSLKLLMLPVAALGLAACDINDLGSSANIYPVGNNTYKITTLSENERWASQGAIQRATNLCQSQNKGIRVMNEHTFYQGPEFGRKKYLEDKSLNHSEDYKSVMYFRCFPIANSAPMNPPAPTPAPATKAAS